MPLITDNLEVLINYEGPAFQDTSENEFAIDSGTVAFESVSPLVGEFSGLYDGIDDYLSLGDILGFSASQPHTLASWVNLVDVTQFQPIISNSTTGSLFPINI